MRKGSGEKCNIRHVTCSGVIKNSKHAQIVNQWNWLQWTRAQGLRDAGKHICIYISHRLHSVCQCNGAFIGEQSVACKEIEISLEIVTKNNLVWSSTRLYTRCWLCAKHEWKSCTHTPHLLSLSLSLPVCSGGRFLILVRQPDPRFTPRVWLPPIVHCQGLLMGGQQWIPFPHKWLSDRAPSSISSYNVGLQRTRPAGGLIRGFICSFQKLLSLIFLLSAK